MTDRSHEPLTLGHLAELADPAGEDRERFLISQPDFRDFHLATVLAQGAGQDWVNRTTAISDLDVWTIFAPPPGHPTFPAGVRHRHVDLAAR